MYTVCTVCGRGSAKMAVVLSCDSDSEGLSGPGNTEWGLLQFRLNETSGEIMDPEKRCGSTLTYAYFVSFIFLCRSLNCA
jgi:hypothetical protein